MNPAIEALVEVWRTKADDFREWGDHERATMLERCAAEVENQIATEEERMLTVAQAAEESGYSVAHLYRSLREGHLPNAGSHGNPRIRRKDLPQKTGS